MVKKIAVVLGDESPGGCDFCERKATYRLAKIGPRYGSDLEVARSCRRHLKEFDQVINHPMTKREVERVVEKLRKVVQKVDRDIARKRASYTQNQTSHKGHG